MTSREVIVALYDAYARRDAAGMVALLDEDVEWMQIAGSPYAGVHVGPDAVLTNVWKRMGTEWTAWEAVPDLIIAEGDRITAVGTYRGTYNATGKSMEARFAHVYAVRNGKIVRMEHFADTVSIAAALS